MSIDLDKGVFLKCLQNTQAYFVVGTLIKTNQVIRKVLLLDNAYNSDNVLHVNF